MTSENPSRELYPIDEYRRRFPPIIVKIPNGIPHPYPLGTDYQITEDLSLVVYHIPRDVDTPPVLIRKYLSGDWFHVQIIPESPTKESENESNIPTY
jgi:hypothetical protein